MNLYAEYEANDAHRTSAVITLEEPSFIPQTNDNSHESCHENEHNTEHLLHRELKF